MRAVIEQSLRQNWQRLFGYALRLSGSRDVADDLLQSCALRALASATPPREAQAARAWLFKIVRNAWIDEHRRAAVRATEPPAEPLDGAGWRYDDRLIAEITVKQAIVKLDADHRDIIELVDLAGFRYAEAAKILDLPMGTVMSRLSRARGALLQLIELENIRPIETSRRHAG